ncbi:hypothetical protein [Kluyvera sp. M-M157-B]|uniref:hypothetical protein n=1 Tax=Kluyvera sp. M-M157-B TaxID=3402291 RepID=UPI003B245FA4
MVFIELSAGLLVAVVVLARAALVAQELVVLLIALVATVVTAQQLVRSVLVQAAVRRWAVLRGAVAVGETLSQLAVAVLLVIQRRHRVAGTGTQVQ